MVIDLPKVPVEQLSDEPAISTVTLAELVAGPHASDVPAERAARSSGGNGRRQPSIHCPSTPKQHDVTGRSTPWSGRPGGRAAGRQSRRRVADLQIASIAVAYGLPLLTRNPADFSGLESILTVVAV